MNKAKTLAEALPYIKQFYGKNVIVKYGGSIVGKDLAGFARDIVLMKFVGIKPIVVHGGGRQIQKELDTKGIGSEFLFGLRVTDKRTMKVVERVLAGRINRHIVSEINKNGAKAVGMSGVDGKTITVKKADIKKIARQNGASVDTDADLGMVGDITRINTALIRRCEKSGCIPVIAPIGTDGKGSSYNVNADHAAGKVASALKAEKLIMLTDVTGIKGKNGRLIHSLTFRQAAKLIKEGVISKGMHPKTTCCVEAISEGVRKAHIIDGRTDHALILEIFTNAGIGTEIKK